MKKIATTISAIVTYVHIAQSAQARPRSPPRHPPPTVATSASSPRRSSVAPSPAITNSRTNGTVTQTSDHRSASVAR